MAKGNKNPILPPSNVGKKYTRTVEDHRVSIFKQFYSKPDSYTFGNIYQSGIRAGYSEDYSLNISAQRPKWWVEFIESVDFKRARMLQVAENNLLEAVSDTSENRDDKKIKHDATKFITERLGKDKYSTRQEVTGADGRRLFTNEKRVDATIPLTNLFKGVEQAQ